MSERPVWGLDPDSEAVLVFKGARVTPRPEHPRAAVEIHAMTVVWVCECGRTRANRLSSAYCPECKSEYMTRLDGSIAVLRGSWAVHNV